MLVELSRYELAVLSYVASNEYSHRRRAINPDDGPNLYCETVRRLRNKLQQKAKKREEND
jgi:hypothetical protein